MIAFVSFTAKFGDVLKRFLLAFSGLFPSQFYCHQGYFISSR